MLIATSLQVVIAWERLTSLFGGGNQFLDGLDGLSWPWLTFLTIFDVTLAGLR